MEKVREQDHQIARLSETVARFSADIEKLRPGRAGAAKSDSRVVKAEERASERRTARILEDMGL